MPGYISVWLVQCACVKERVRDYPHDLNICETERKYTEEKSCVGPQYPDTTDNILCRRYLLLTFNISSGLFNATEKYEMYCPQWLVGCGWAAFFFFFYRKSAGKSLN